MSNFLVDNDVYSICYNKVSHRYDVRIKALGSGPYGGMVYVFVDYPPEATVEPGRPGEASDARMNAVSARLDVWQSDGIPSQYRPLAEEFARKAMKELLGF